MRIFKIIYEYKGLNDSEVVYGNNKPEALRKFIKGQNLTDLISKLELKHISLVVHDWGGAIGFGYATRFPANLPSC
jgi:hypothetical protein